MFAFFLTLRLRYVAMKLLRFTLSYNFCLIIHISIDI